MTATQLFRGSRVAATMLGRAALLIVASPLLLVGLVGYALALRRDRADHETPPDPL